MPILLFFLLSFAKCVFGLDSLELSPRVQQSTLQITPLHFLRDEGGHLSHREALDLFKHNRFLPLEEPVKSFGFSDATYWVAFTITENPSNDYLLEFDFDQLKTIVSFVYSDTVLRDVTKNGYAVPWDGRSVRHSAFRFHLWQSQLPMTYLFKIESKRPIIIATHIGTRVELDYHQQKNLVTFIFFMGVFFIVFVANMMLYFEYKMKTYLYHALYLISLLLFLSYVNSYTYLFTQNYHWINDWIKILSIIGVHISTLLFNVQLLNLHQLSKRVTYLIYGMCLFVFLSFVWVFFGTHQEYIAVMSGVFIPLFSLAVVVYAWRKKVEFAHLYFIGLLGFYSGLFLFWSMQMGFILMSSLSKSILLYGSMFEILIFIWILILKGKSLKSQYTSVQKKMTEKEAEYFYQSKYISIGRTIGNVAHQWKSPLNSLGAVLTNIKCTLLMEEKIDRKTLIEYTDVSSEIVQHLAETIDSFYHLLIKNNSKNSFFSLTRELTSIQKIMSFALQNKKISLRCSVMVNAQIFSNANEFTQVMFNMISNAVEQFETVTAPHPQIVISLTPFLNEYRITLQDNAGGIAISPIEKIFAPYVTNKKHGGGIGLFICKQIIEEHFRGNIFAENKHQGACFTIILPKRFADESML